jgi:hypothetical protein
MILSSLLILALIVASGILLSSMLLPFQLLRASSDSSDTDTNTDQDLNQKNTGSGESTNLNCGEDLIDSSVSVICLSEPPPPPPPPETATLSVCKEALDPNFPPNRFIFTVTGNNPSPAQFRGDNSDGCVDVTIGPGEYAVSENLDVSATFTATILESDCVQDPNVPGQTRAIGEIQAGETQVCRFLNVAD